MGIVARFFPNGEFTHGVDTSRARRERRKKERRHEPLASECRDRYLQWVRTHPNADIDLCVRGQSFLSRDGLRLWVYLGYWENHHHYAMECANGQSYQDVIMDYPIARGVGEGAFIPLVHQMVESSPSPPKSRKRLESMTKNMARNIRNGVYCLEQWYGKDQLSFLTLTLPNLSTDELTMCCEKWDYATDQILKWLRKRLQKLNIEFQYVYCTEIQLKRLQSRGEYAPHLHIVFRGRYAKKTPWAITPAQVRKAWCGILSSIIGHSKFDGRACENLQRIKYSAARYLSKYMSKGNCCIPLEQTEQPIKKLRTQWGGMARTVSQGIRRATVRMCQSASNGELAVCILRHMDKLLAKNLVRYYRQGFIVTSVCSSTGTEYGINVGCGCLQTPTYEGGLSSIIAFIQREQLIQGLEESNFGLPRIASREHTVR